jgi:Ca2+/H+ antiporter, TMEM165/GDT1 family
MTERPSADNRVARMVDLAHVSLAQAGSAISASFLASLVEFVEALTIVLAVGFVSGWRPALIGTAAGTAVLAALVALLGPALGAIPIAYLQLLIGLLLLLFGLRWLRKAVLRAAGVIPLHDELKVFAEETEMMTASLPRGTQPPWWDPIAVAATFKAILLEGMEVVFIVIAVGSTGNLLMPAALGAAIAGGLVLLAGVALHRPLAKVPENSLKWAVGILLSAFGIFWIGEGLGLPWPGEDLAILALAGAFLAVSLAIVALLRGRPVGARP